MSPSELPPPATHGAAPAPDDPPARPGGLRSRLGGPLRVLFGVAGVAFMVVAFLQTWDRSQGLTLPSWSLLLAALASVLADLVVALFAWSTLLRPPRGTAGGRAGPAAGSPRAVAPGFFLAQLGKYVPGAVWQAVGQVGYATRAHVSVARASVSFVVFALTQAVAGGVLGAATALLAPDLPGLLRIAAASGVLLLVLLDRRWLLRAVRLAERRRPQLDAETLVADQASILRSVAYSVVVMALAGLAFALVLAGTAPDVGFLLAAVPAFSLAWAVGFLALPFPAGLGVREAVLLATLGTVVPAAGLIAASVLLRLVFMVAEALCILATRVGPLRAPTALRSGGRTRPPR